MNAIRQRLPIIAIFVVLMTLYGALVWQNQSHKEGRATNQNAPVAESINGGSIGDGVQSVPAENDTRDQPQQTYKETSFEKSERLEFFDHIAQINMAIAAWFGVALGVFGSVLLLFTLRYTRDAARAANSTLEVARSASISELRPYLEFSDLQIEVPEDGHFFIDEGVVEFRGRIDITNHGKTPAELTFFKWNNKTVLEDGPFMRGGDDKGEINLLHYVGPSQKSYMMVDFTSKLREPEDDGDIKFDASKIAIYSDFLIFYADEFSKTDRIIRIHLYGYALYNDENGIRCTDVPLAYSREMKSQPDKNGKKPKANYFRPLFESSKAGS